MILSSLAYRQAARHLRLLIALVSMTTPLIIQNIPCTLVTGFLGAGKTTLINQLLGTKPKGARWALLINEFGRIGIDGSLLTQDNSNQQNIAISEVSGGCICCTSQLPLQIALSRLLSEHRPQRLIIEPTGLAHPRELLRQLSEPHWQTALNLRAVITVLSAIQWQNEKYRYHDGFQAHIQAADVVVINRYEHLNANYQHELQSWILALNPHAQLIWSTSPEKSETTLSKSITDKLTLSLNIPSQILNQQTSTLSQSRIHLQSPMQLLSSKTGRASKGNIVNEMLPYRYHDSQQGMIVGGWRLPAEWVFDADALQQWLLALPQWQRIKGVINTSDGWLQFNFTPDSLSTATTNAQVDSRLEIILQNSSNESDKAIHSITQQQDSRVRWAAWDNELMALIV